MATLTIDKNLFNRGDKVIHALSEDDEMVGTVLRALPNDNYVVEFWIPGRRKGGYMTELDFHVSELTPCFIDIEKTKRQSA